MIPETLSEEEEQQVNEEIAAFRVKLLKERTEEDRLLAELMKLRILMKEYIENEPYSEGHDFGDYLADYVRILQKPKKEIAGDLDIHFTQFSRIVNNREKPNIEFLYRLEEHGGRLIPAVFWWKLLVKRQEHELTTNETARAAEAARVKNSLKFRA